MDGAGGEAPFVAGEEGAGAIDMPDEAVDIETPAGVGIAVFPFRDRNTKILRQAFNFKRIGDCLLYTSPSPRDRTRSRMPSSA